MEASSEAHTQPHSTVSADSRPIPRHKLGSALEAALQERQRNAPEAAPDPWVFRGVEYRLRPEMPTSAALIFALAQREDDQARIIDGVKSFFVPPDGDKFVEAIVDPNNPIDLKYLEGMFTELTEYYSQRPLVNAES